jgi:hypothetical protein
MQNGHGHEAWSWTCIGHAAWIWRCDMEMDTDIQIDMQSVDMYMQHVNMDLQHGHGHAAWRWTCNIDIDIQHGPGHTD